MEIPSQIEQLLSRFVADSIERDRIRRAILRADAAAMVCEIEREYRREVSEIITAADKRARQRALRVDSSPEDPRKRRRRRAPRIASL